MASTIVGNVKSHFEKKKSLVDEIQAPPAPEPSTAPLPSHQWQSPGLHPKTEQPGKMENLEVLFFSIKVSPPLQISRFSLRYNTNGNFFVMTSSHTSSLCLPPSSLHSRNCSRNSSTLFMASICSLPSSASSDQPSD